MRVHDLGTFYVSTVVWSLVINWIHAEEYDAYINRIGKLLYFQVRKLLWKYHMYDWMSARFGLWWWQ